MTDKQIGKCNNEKLTMRFDSDDGSVLGMATIMKATTMILGDTRCSENAQRKNFAVLKVKV